MSTHVRVLASTALVLVLAGCAATSSDRGGARPSADREQQSAPETGYRLRPAPLLVPDGKPRRALLSIPVLGLRDLPVIPYRGSPDDAPGTRIQDGGMAASPFGRRGGTGPGGIGNYLVTAHRTSSTRAFERLPALGVGDRVHVVAGGRRYVYEIVATRSTSFRSARSLARQSAEVPGRPGREAVRPMITLSTCATPEDHARGNYWSDRFGNPEHRIDKIGVLVANRPR
jgi:sortase A